MQKFSVLMSVYYKEKPEYLDKAIESILCQTISSDNFVLVCDGPLSEALENVIEKYSGQLYIVRLPQNCGLGNALNKGLACCKYDLVARMDSDDISKLDRCEKQVNCFEKHMDLDIVSGTVSEFTDSPEYIMGRRELPTELKTIIKFSHKRNPFNHPAVMFRKSAVYAVGGYNSEYPLFEDYYLWVRMLKYGCKAMNLKEPILYMRTSADIYMRRGGKQYAKDMLKFHQWLMLEKWSTKIDYWTGAIPHAVVCVLPNGIRKLIYEKLIHRK